MTQKLEVRAGGAVIATYRQKVTSARYQLKLDFNRDTTAVLDRRLGVAAAIIVALHQNRQM